MFERTEEPLLSIWRWAEKYSGLQAIWDEPNESRPTGDYVSIGLLTGPEKQGQDELRHLSGDDYLSGGQRAFTVTVSVYGLTSMSVMEVLHNSLGRPTVLEEFRAVGLALFREENVQDTSTLVETGFEKRATMDVKFGYRSDTVDAVRFIETVELTNGIDGSTFEVP